MRNRKEPPDINNILGDGTSSDFSMKNQDINEGRLDSPNKCKSHDLNALTPKEINADLLTKTKYLEAIHIMKKESLRKE